MDIYQSGRNISFEQIINYMEAFKLKVDAYKNALSKITDYIDIEDLQNDEGLIELAKAIIYNLSEEEKQDVMTELNAEIYQEKKAVM